jgi:hypothetical protein
MGHSGGGGRRRNGRTSISPHLARLLEKRGLGRKGRRGLLKGAGGSQRQTWMLHLKTSTADDKALQSHSTNTATYAQK